MVSDADQVKFHLTGLIDGPFEQFSLMNVVLTKQYPTPVLVMENDSHVFQHPMPTWSSLHHNIDLCAGFGGFCQGSTACGFYTKVAVDVNDRMAHLYSKQCNSDFIVGDVCQLSTMVKIWDAAKGAGTLTARFSCQPFSLLGDQSGELDARSSCLTGVLSIAYFTRVHAVVLECVSPAAQNGFVKAEIARFVQATGFHCTQQELCLQDRWPSRRSRAWWILSSPMLGAIPFESLPKSLAISKVSQVICQVLPWDKHDEFALELSPIERSAFGADSDQYVKYLLNFEGCAPCALHAGGSQLTPCECGCRSTGLSMRRLEEKGLFGLLIQSAPDDSGVRVLRHVHPNEAMGLNGFDPVLDFGENVRLTLAATGQLASPLQVVWVMSHIAARIEELKHGTVTFLPIAQLTAYETWLLSRCRQVWPVEVENIHDKNMTSLIDFWSNIPQMSIHEMVYPPNWPELNHGDPTIASILDHVIRKHQALASLSSEVPDDVCEASGSDELDDEPPTPWHDHFLRVASGYACAAGKECVLVFHHEFADPVRVQVQGGETVRSLIQAHFQLVIVDPQGQTLHPEHVVQPGQVVCIRCEDTSASSDMSQLRVSYAPSSASDHVMTECPPAWMEEPTVDREISPTVPWTQPIEEPSIAPVPIVPMVSMSEQCRQHALDHATVVNQSWISAAPLLGLEGEQFLKIAPPVVLNDQHLWSLQNHLLQVEDRITILSHQHEVWSDDEFRFHMSLLTKMYHDHQIKHGLTSPKECVVIDPLVTQACIPWSTGHGEVKTKGLPVIGVFQIDSHWVPFVLIPNGDVLQASTWDAPHHDHSKMNQILSTLGTSLGFVSVQILRVQRLFFATQFCGALAMGFLLHSLIDMMLPNSHDD